MILGLLLGLAGLIALAFGVAAVMLPNESSFRQETVINAPPEKVWEVIMDHAKLAEWGPNIEKVEVIDENNWREYPKDSPEPINFRVVKAEKTNRLELAYSMGDYFAGGWTGEFTATPSGTNLVTEDRMKVSSNFTKVMMAPFFNLEDFARKWNAALKARVEGLK